MKKVRFTKQQVIGILKQHQQLKTADLRYRLLSNKHSSPSYEDPSTPNSQNSGYAHICVGRNICYSSPVLVGPTIRSLWQAAKTRKCPGRTHLREFPAHAGSCARLKMTGRHFPLPKS